MGNKMGCSNPKDPVQKSFDPPEPTEPLPSPGESKPLANQAYVRDHYDIDKKVLGRGQYGEVFRATHKDTSEVFAIKRIVKHKVRRQHILRREMEFLLRANHPNIINVVDLIEDANRLWIVQEFCSGGELFDRIIDNPDGMTEQTAARIVQQVLAGIQHCHDELGVVHRDLKPENILFKTKDADSELVIIDFGLAGEMRPGAMEGKVKVDKDDAHAEHLKTTVGTPYYIAPEVFTKNYGRECDIWSIGVIAYILLCGFPPYSGNDEKEIMQAVRSGRDVTFQEEYWGNISNEAKDFISNLMKRTPSERPSAADALKHPWFTRTDTAPLSLYRTIGPRLEIFNSMNRLKKMAAMVIVDRARNKEIEELKKMFEEIDADGSGAISLDELHVALADRPAQAGLEFDAFFEGIDVAGEQEISYNEFLAAAMCPSVRMEETNIKKAFKYFDKSNTNFITVEDLCEIVGDESTARELIGEADFRHDNKIAYDEFKQMMSMAEHKTLLSGTDFSSEDLLKLAIDWRTAGDDEKNTSVKTLSDAADIIGFDINQVQIATDTWTFVTAVESKTPAEEAGICVLDLLQKLGDTEVGTDGCRSAGEIVDFIRNAVKDNEPIAITVGTLPSHAVYRKVRANTTRRGSGTSRRSIAGGSLRFKVDKDGELRNAAAADE
eukprot:CAMPEP_0119482742 /NCGR_PEP_ID=MMETSP1344-20130328/10463_1 /TAXON_ID=236787 /ORGANISM="Florenciella parvula, Strain CCMP2471" /LENGTH=664 /DNA_ID=CAMNT_0007517179 /DNA_START=269 /DNA_END=2263 /DNA_ORIENTATION=-